LSTSSGRRSERAQGARDAQEARGECAARGAEAAVLHHHLEVDEELIDTVLLAAAAKTEHVEIAMCGGLITKAEAMGADDVVALLEENLEQEQHTLEEVRQAAHRLSTELAAQAA
jgi:ferritin-like metal-binding protein YciE